MTEWRETSDHAIPEGEELMFGMWIESNGLPQWYMMPGIYDALTETAVDLNGDDFYDNAVLPVSDFTHWHKLQLSSHPDEPNPPTGGEG